MPDCRASADVDMLTDGDVGREAGVRADDTPSSNGDIGPDIGARVHERVSGRVSRDKPLAKHPVPDATEDRRLWMFLEALAHPPEERPERREERLVDVSIVDESEQPRRRQAREATSPEHMSDLAAVPARTDDDDLPAALHRPMVSRPAPMGR